MPEQIAQIIKNLESRGESKDEIIQYLTYILQGLYTLNPKTVSEYLDITLHNQRQNENTATKSL